MNRVRQTLGPVRKLLSYHLPVLLYAVGVVVISSIPNLKAPAAEFLPFGIDRLAHLLEYAIFALLTFRSFSRISSAVSSRAAVLLAFLFLSGFAALDEYHQGSIPGRSPDSLDLICDISGAFIVLAYIWLRRRRREPKPA